MDTMKTRLILFLALVLFSTAAFSQEYKKHTVAKGETMKSIAKKYTVTPYDIQRLNPAGSYITTGFLERETHESG